MAAGNQISPVSAPAESAALDKTAAQPVYNGKAPKQDGGGMAGTADLAAEARGLLKRGKRVLLESQTQQASALFEQALQLLVATYGPLAIECGEAYKLYGTTLLDLAKQEASMFGEGGGAEASEAPAPGGGNGEAASADDDQYDDEDATTLQIAYETLECARVVLSKATAKSDLLLLANVHNQLGEFNLETGNFEQSAAEFESCLKRRMGLCPPNSRILAESHYFLAVAYQHGEAFSKAIPVYEAAVGILKRNIAEATKANASEAEIKGLKGLVHEIERKTADAKDEAATKKRQAKAAAAQPTTTIGFGQPKAAVGKGAGKRAADDGVTTVGFGGGTKKNTPVTMLDTSLVRKKKKTAK